MKATVSNQSTVLKRLYPDGVEKVIYDASRLFERCKKDTKFTNEDKAVVVRISGTSGGSANFPDALASQGPSQRARFIVNRKKEYQIYSVDGEAVAATDGDPKAIVNIVKNEATEAMYKLGRTMARRVTGAGGGNIGVIHSSTTLTGAVLLLASDSDVQWLEVGDYIQFSDTDGTSSSADPAVDLRGSGDALRVTAIDREASPPQVTVNANLDTITGIAVGDFVFRRGDYSRAMTGVQGWLPQVAPDSTPFFGVNRTAYDLIRLAGFRYTAGAGGSYGDAIIKAGARAVTHGITDLTALYMSAVDFGEFVIEVGAQRLRDAKDSSVGYQYIEVHTPMAKGGVLKVIAEPHLPVGYCWAINDDLLEFSTAGAFPSMLDHAGLGSKGLLTPADDDALQGRLGGYGNFIYRNPGKAVIIKLAA